MKCFKCLVEIERTSKFCNNCGTEIHEKSLELREVVRDFTKVWYVLGYIKGSDKAWSDKIEKYLASADEELREWHREIIEYWQNWAKENNN